MKFSIVIPTYNNVSYLENCLRSVFEHTDLSDGEVIVVANGCTDSTGKVLLSYKDRYEDRLIGLWDSEPLGYSKAVNKGIRAAKGDVVILLNNDTVLQPQPKGEWVRTLCEPLERDPSVGITGLLPLWSGETERIFLVFFCVAIHRRVFRKIGTLNEMFGVGFGEDMEFCWRAEEAGFSLRRVPESGDLGFDQSQKLHVLNFPIFHKGGATVGDYDNQRIVRENCARLKALVESRKPLP